MAFENQHKHVEKAQPHESQHTGESHALRQANELQRAGSVQKTEAGSAATKPAGSEKPLDFSDPYSKSELSTGKSHQGFPGARDGANPSDAATQAPTKPGDSTNGGKAQDIEAAYAKRNPLGKTAGESGADQVGSKPGDTRHPGDAQHPQDAPTLKTDAATQKPGAPGKDSDAAAQTPNSRTSSSKLDQLNQRMGGEPNQGTIEDVRANWAARHSLGSKFMSPNGGSDQIKPQAPTASKDKPFQEKPFHDLNTAWTIPQLGSKQLERSH